METENNTLNEISQILIDSRNEELKHMQGLFDHYNEVTAQLSRWPWLKPIIFRLADYDGFVKITYDLILKSQERLDKIEKRLQKHLLQDPY